MQSYVIKELLWIQRIPPRQKAQRTFLNPCRPRELNQWTATVPTTIKRGMIPIQMLEEIVFGPEFSIGIGHAARETFPVIDMSVFLLHVGLKVIPLAEGFGFAPGNEAGVWGEVARYVNPGAISAGAWL